MAAGVRCARFASCPRRCASAKNSCSRPHAARCAHAAAILAKAVRTDPKVMGGMAVKKVLAVGESQSAMRLSIYLNSYLILIKFKNEYCLYKINVIK